MDNGFASQRHTETGVAAARELSMELAVSRRSILGFALLKDLKMFEASRFIMDGLPVCFFAVLVCRSC